MFYEHIDQGFDVFVHTEDDTLIRPTTVLAFMHEMDKVRQLVGDKVRLMRDIHLVFCIVMIQCMMYSLAQHNSNYHTLPPLIAEAST